MVTTDFTGSYFDLTETKKLVTMQKKFLLSSGSLDSYDSGAESDASDSSTRSCLKRVQFSPGPSDTDPHHITDNAHEYTTRKNGERRHNSTIVLLHKNRYYANGFSVRHIDRGDIPDGSDVFRQVLKEIKSTTDEEVCTPRSDCDTPTKPLKSILKKHT